MVNLSTMSAEEKAALKKQLEQEEKATKEKVQQDRETYKKLVDECVASMFERLKMLSLTLVEEKDNVFKSFEQILLMKAELYGVKNTQQSHTFTTTDGKFSVKLGHRVTDGYDDSINVGIQKVQDYLKTLAKDDNSAALVETILSLLKRDEKGNMKASRVIELEKLAIKTQDENFIDGIRIIKDAYRPVKSCQFVTVSYRDENGKEQFLPLSMSSAE